MKTALTIAGSDSSGGAGIQADLKTFSALGVFGMSVITAVTAQNTTGIFAVEDISREVVEKQIQAIFEDIKVDAVKIGMVSRTETILAIADKLPHYQTKNIVVDPVMISKSGCNLLKPEAREAMISKLLPLALLVTPNLPEAEVLSSLPVKNLQDMEKAAQVIRQMGPQYVLVKGGHLKEGVKESAVDVLYDGKSFRYYERPRVLTKNTHGTGCTLSSALAANLARGYAVEEAVALAKEYITIAIMHSFSLGKGVGPTHHFYDLYRRAGLCIEEKNS